MPRYRYVARTPTGSLRKGVQEAVSEAALAASLIASGFLVVNLSPETEQTSSIIPLPSLKLWTRSIDVEVGLQQVAVMLRSGMTLITALRTAAEQSERQRMADLWNNVADRIRDGAGFAESLAVHKRFPHVVVRLAQVGEQTGTLDAVLTRAAEQMESKRVLRTQLFTALFYPAIVLLSAIGVTGLLVFYLIPRLQVFLTALGKKMPPLTQALIDVTNFMNDYALHLGGGLFGLTALGIAVYLRPSGRLFMDRWILRVPVIGTTMRLAATTQFAHSMGVLIVSGVPLLEALRTVEGMFRNRFLSGIVGGAREGVLSGGGLATGLDRRGGFLPMLHRMTAVGESAGSLDDMMFEVARFHEGQLKSMIKRLSVVIEPVIIFVVGGIVGFVYIAFFMALFSVAGGGGR